MIGPIHNFIFLEQNLLIPDALIFGVEANRLHYHAPVEAANLQNMK